MSKEKLLHEKAIELQKAEQGALVLDFDEALEEYETENRPIEVRFLGKVYHVPPKMPFSFAMFYFRHCVEKKGGKTVFAVPEERMAEFISRMFGKEFLGAVEGSAVDTDFVFSTIAAKIMEQWGYGMKDTAGKNVKTPGS